MGCGAGEDGAGLQLGENTPRPAVYKQVTGQLAEWPFLGSSTAFILRGRGEAGIGCWICRVISEQPVPAVLPGGAGADPLMPQRRQPLPVRRQ